MDKLDEFITHLQIQRGLSRNTVNAYKSDIERFLAFLISNPKASNDGFLHPLHLKQAATTTTAIKSPIQDIETKNISKANFESYCSYLYKNNIKATSTNRKISAIKSFLRFLDSKSEVLLTKSFKTPRKIPMYLTQEQIFAMADKAIEQKKQSPLFVRAYAILCLLYCSGMRISECLSLKISDINQDQIIINGKGGRERVVFLNKDAKKALKYYLAVRSYFTTQMPKGDNGHLFCSRGGLGYYSRQNFFIALKKLANACGIDENNVSPHKIRHSFATHLYNSGTDLFTLQQALGHANVSTTQIYTHLEKNKLSQAINLAHPLAKKNSNYPQGG